LNAPHLLDVEVTQVIRRYAAIGAIDAERGRSALVDLGNFPLRRYPHGLLLPRVCWHGDVADAFAAIAGMSRGND
jgi:predicted nucleic acid-binding protein